MYWTFTLADYLNDAPWPATKRELVDFCNRTGAPADLLDNLEELPDDEDLLFHGIDDLWPDRPSRAEFYYDENE